MSATPYASVIIPTHDRFATLATTVRSVQAQTVDDIEILIVADGATQPVKAIANGLAGQDPRVRLLDLPKAPGRGAANRDKGVREARSDRIFYTDDDDIWLASHVATLGPMLEEAHIVDSVAVSVSVTGRLFGTLGHAGHPTARGLLARNLFKLQYDTHLTHRRSTYLTLGEAWREEGATDIVHNLFAAFANAQDVRWLSLDRPTALSLHGAGRKGLTPAQRRDEIETWLDRSRAMTPESLLAELRYEPTFLRTLHLLPPSSDEDLDAYLERTGVTLDRSRQDRSLLTFEVDAANRGRLLALFGLFVGRIDDPTTLKEIVLPALDPLLGSKIAIANMRRFLRGAFGVAGALDFVRNLDSDRPRELTFRDALECDFLFDLKRFAEAKEVALRMVANARIDEVVARHRLARALLNTGQGAEALEQIDAADAVGGPTFETQLFRASALLKLGDRPRAQELVEALAESRPGHAGVVRLRAALDAPPPVLKT